MITAYAPGKINIALDVGPPAADGYHPLATVFQAVSLYEVVHAELAADISVSVSGLSADQVPTDGANLAVRAARLLAEATGTESGARLHVTKSVPTAGGMGGGSADAAAALVACDQLWRTQLSKEELGELAVQLGADVPFALNGHSALGLGRGDLLTPALTRGQFHWAAVLSDEGMSTPEVFRTWDHIAAQDAQEPQPPQELLRALAVGDVHQLAAAMSNDLAPASLQQRPELAQVIDACQETEALGSLISGSGPTVVALAADAAAAGRIAEQLQARVDAGEIPGSQVLAVRGPVGGAGVEESVS